MLEPLNPKNHPGLFLTKIPQAYQICQAVNSPSCKIVNDIYHQQITEGNLIPNIEAAWDEIAAFHLGDNPGRKEPTSGEINYRNIFKYIHAKRLRGRAVHGARPEQAGQGRRTRRDRRVPRVRPVLSGCRADQRRMSSQTSLASARSGQSRDREGESHD